MLEKNKKIFICILNNVIDTVGGSITSFYTISNLLINNNYEVYGIFHKKDESFKEKKLDNGLNLINIFTKDKSQVTYFEELVQRENPDLIIFFYSRDVMKLLGNNYFENTSKILLNRSRPDFYAEYLFIKDKLSHISCIQVLFDSYIPLVRKFYSGSIRTIGNVVKIPDKQADLSIEKKKIIYLSRIDVWKGQEFLIKSFALIAKKYPEWTINIYGQFDPPNYRKKLKNLIKKYKLEKQILLKGITKNPVEKFLEADFCVFPSYFEGFPNGLSEALATGLPAIGFSKCSGVNELIENDFNGFLVEEDYSEFAEKIKYLIDNQQKRIQMGLNSIESVKKYNQENIENQWKSLIEDVLNNELTINDYSEDLLTKEIFSMSKIHDLQYKNRYLSFLQRIFSINNLGEKKMICFLGLKFKIKRLIINKLKG